MADDLVCPECGHWDCVFHAIEENMTDDEEESDD